MWSGLSRQSGLCQGSARLPGEPGSRRGCLVSPGRREAPPPRHTEARSVPVPIALGLVPTTAGHRADKVKSMLAHNF